MLRHLCKKLKSNSGKFDWMWGSTEIKDAMLGTKPGIETQIIKDPLKEAVATPLSSYLASKVGQGVPRYSGALSAPVTEDTGLIKGGGSSLSDFLSMDANSYFDKYVQDPTMQNWKQNIAPVIQEGWAGSLSGSGRFSDLTSSGSTLSAELAKQRGEFGVQLPQAQYEVTKSMRQQDWDINAARTAQVNEAKKLEYADWLKSLPEYNPILDKAMSFLSESTNTGTTILSALNPGTEGMLKDILKILATVAGAAAI